MVILRATNNNNNNHAISDGNGYRTWLQL